MFENGEAAKNQANFFNILNFLAENKLSRSDIVIALGGGVVGDLAGFAAACYMRGVKFVQIPTTLLAAVDSSVGGKTGINLDAGKNLAGAFYQPEIVICDVSALSTLNSRVFADGCAEIIKYGVIYDRDLFDSVKNYPVNNINNLDLAKLEEIISRCVEIKRDIVNLDEYENGIRKLLNFGHTLGHAAELLSGYKISHGYSVAAGMAVITRASVKTGICEKACLEELLETLELYNLPVNINYTAKELSDACLSDKKRGGNILTVILPEKTGVCVLRDIELDENNKNLEDFISLGLNEL